MVRRAVDKHVQCKIISRKRWRPALTMARDPPSDWASTQPLALAARDGTYITAIRAYRILSPLQAHRPCHLTHITYQFAHGPFQAFRSVCLAPLSPLPALEKSPLQPRNEAGARDPACRSKTEVVGGCRSRRQPIAPVGHEDLHDFPVTTSTRNGASSGSKIGCTTSCRNARVLKSLLDRA